MPMQTIMIIDDDEADHFICKYTIRKFDPSITVIAAYNGREALEMLHQSMPDAIVLDINMPIMNGFDFLDRYAVEFEVHAPVVAMLTSSPLGEDRERALQYEFVKTYFEKPLTVGHLHTMRELLDTD